MPVIESPDKAFIESISHALLQHGIRSSVELLGPDETGAPRYGVTVLAQYEPSARRFLYSDRHFLASLHYPPHIAELLQRRADNLNWLGSLLSSRLVLGISVTSLLIVAVASLLP